MSEKFKILLRGLCVNLSDLCDNIGVNAEVTEVYAEFAEPRNSLFLTFLSIQFGLFRHPLAILFLPFYLGYSVRFGFAQAKFLGGPL
jgi:hypothetical protein